MDAFRGRKAELRILNQKFQQKGFVMTVLYGKRRVGKTTLVNQFIQEHDCKRISFTAVEREEKELLSMMTEAVLLSLSPDMADSIQFNSFERLFEFIGTRAREERIIFFIDEYPYLAKQCPYIQSVLQKVIDTSWKAGNLFLILCGSLVSFMKEEVLAESAPLHGRSNLELKLRPFNYLEAADFLDGFTNEDKAVCYGLTNGVAKYIAKVPPISFVAARIMATASSTAFTASVAAAMEPVCPTISPLARLQRRNLYFPLLMAATKAVATSMAFILGAWSKGILSDSISCQVSSSSSNLEELLPFQK